ncbi:hypothetical protein Tco_1457843 [Tanacetum coccineum]
MLRAPLAGGGFDPSFTLTAYGNLSCYDTVLDTWIGFWMEIHVDLGSFGEETGQMTGTYTNLLKFYATVDGDGVAALSDVL